MYFREGLNMSNQISPLVTPREVPSARYARSGQALNFPNPERALSPFIYFYSLGLLMSFQVLSLAGLVQIHF